ncbi:MAG TPA: hypothetical protein VGD01_10375 [Candidatus Elarobacter sp.]|jgi:hypothetical protein
MQNNVEALAAKGLKANIRRMYLFGTAVGFLNAPNPPFGPYFGDPLYITNIFFDAAHNELVVNINDQGPPSAVVPVLPPVQPGAATRNVHATLSIGGTTPKVTASAPLPDTVSTGVGLAFGAVLEFDSDLNTPLVAPSVELFAVPAPDDDFLAYVAINVAGTRYIRWIDAPLEVAPAASASVVKSGKIGGVMGPWGLEGS